MGIFLEIFIKYSILFYSIDVLMFVYQLSKFERLSSDLDGTMYNYDKAIRMQQGCKIKIKRKVDWRYWGKIKIYI